MARSAALCPESYPLPRSDQAQARVGRLPGIPLLLFVQLRSPTKAELSSA